MSEQNGKESEMGEMEQAVTRAVAQALQEHLPGLQSQVVQRVLETLPPPSAAVPAASGDGARGLVEAVSRIHAGTNQKEILRALLDAGSVRCTRIALYVVKAGAATGWQARGFGDDESVKDSALDLNAGPAAHAYRNRVTTPGNIAEMGGGFAEKFGGPANEQVLLLPLVLKDKVAALVFADGGDSGRLDSNALELLVMTTSAWLEVISLRKTAAPRGERSPGRATGSSGTNGFFVFRSLRFPRAHARPGESCS